MRARRRHRPAIGLATAISGQVPYADEKNEVYLSKAETKTLLDKPLPGVDGRQITIATFTLPPGSVGGKHYHAGPVYVYVLEGSFTIDEEGKASQTFKAGELYQESIGTPMQALNMSTSEPTKVLAIQVNRQGEPMMYKAE